MRFPVPISVASEVEVVKIMSAQNVCNRGISVSQKTRYISERNFDTDKATGVHYHDHYKAGDINSRGEKNPQKILF